MNKELKQFIEEGVKRYKEASKLVTLFGKTIESELKGILSIRKDWGKFQPNKTKKLRSTKYWIDYPALNANIFGKIGQKNCVVRVTINWYQSETDYPYYEIRIEKGADEELVNKFKGYTENGIFEIHDKSIKFYPAPKDFNLHRDFNKLIDEFIKII